jgi:hypothetical protein
LAKTKHGALGTQAPDWHALALLHATPSSQTVPSAALV